MVTGTAHEAYLAVDVPGDRPQALSDGGGGTRGASSRARPTRISATGCSCPSGWQSSGASDCCVFAGGPYLETRFFGQGYAIAFAKGATDLKHAVNAALQAIYEKGVYAELYLRYFPVGFF